MPTATMPTATSVTLAVTRAATNAAALWAVGDLVDRVAAVALGALGLLAGALHARAVVATDSYPPDRRGAWLAVVDHTWSLPNTVAGSLLLAVALALGNRPDPDRSRHRSTVVLREGVMPGFATTIGTVEAGTTHHLAAHEYLHVLQARLFGPAYLPLVALNYVVATVLPYWLVYHDRTARPIRSVRDYFLRGVYPHTWHEEWAYRVGGGTPP